MRLSMLGTALLLCACAKESAVTTAAKTAEASLRTATFALG